MTASQLGSTPLIVGSNRQLVVPKCTSVTWHAATAPPFQRAHADTFPLSRSLFRTPHQRHPPFDTDPLCATARGAQVHEFSTDSTAWSCNSVDASAHASSIGAGFTHEGQGAPLKRAGNTTQGTPPNHLPSADLGQAAAIFESPQRRPRTDRPPRRTATAELHMCTFSCSYSGTPLVNDTDWHARGAQVLVYDRRQAAVPKRDPSHLIEATLA